MHPYTWGLLDSIPVHSVSEKSELCPIKGQPPSLIFLPTGCPFHPRCPHAQDICRTTVPPLRVIEGTHSAACHFSGDAGFTREGVACEVKAT